jgi:large subunit ribosomal protein L28
MPLLPPAHPSLIQLRSFTCTARTLAKSTKQRLKFEHSSVPEYPYGPSQFYKQSNFGLYGMQKIRFGNMVSEKNEIKTRRYWRPNVHSKRLWSEALQAYIRLRITTRVLRTVDKVGGLDEYLLGEKAGRIKELGMGGWKLRWRIMQTESVKERFRKQRQLMGLPPKEEVLQGSDGMIATKQQVEDEIQKFDEDLQEGKDVDIGEELEEQVTLDEGFMNEEPRSREKVLL